MRETENFGFVKANFENKLFRNKQRKMEKNSNN